MSVHLVFDLLAKAASRGVTWSRRRRLHETSREIMACAGARLRACARNSAPLGTQPRNALAPWIAVMLL